MVAFGPTGTRLRSFPDSSPPFQPRLRSASWFASLANYGGGKPTLALPSHHLRRPFGGAFLFECCFRAPRPSEVPGSPFHRRSAPRGAPCGARISPSGGPGHVCGVSRTLPRPPPSRSRARFPRSPWRRLAHVCTPRSRSAHTTCHPPTSRAKGPRETSHNSPGRVVEVAALAGSRLRAGSLTPTRGRRFGDQPKQAALAFGMRESLSILGRGAGPRPTRERNRSCTPTLLGICVSPLMP